MQSETAMVNDRLRDTSRSRLPSAHDLPPPTPRNTCDGCQLVRFIDDRLATVEAMQRNDGLELAELTGTTMASIEGLRREVNTLSSSIESLRHELRTALGLVDTSRRAKNVSDSYPAKPGTVDAKIGDKYRFRSSAWVAIVMTAILASAWVAKDWVSNPPKQQTTQAGK